MGAGVAGRENDQELRLALAMRGGVSMAVWIGGAVAEIDRLRRSLREPGDEPDPWAALAGLAGYDSVQVDVLAGASAGGLNATLLSASLVYGMPFDQMRELWIRLADVEAMSREVPKFWQPRPPSLLAGDDYLRSELARAISENVPDDQRSRQPNGQLDLLLTATLLDPVTERHFDGRSAPLPQQRRTAAFRFRHRGQPGQPLTDFGAGKDFEATVLRMAQAARSTSSYPFAFEPARVYSSPQARPVGQPDMFGLFSESAPGPDAEPFRVIDGGVLDNIPVTAAIESIDAVPADRPTHRWLLYLNPEPVAPQRVRSPQQRFALPVAGTALHAKLSQESLLQDIEALEEQNRSVARTGLRRRALFAELRHAEPAERSAVLARTAESVEPENAVVRAELDAQAVHRLLTERATVEEGKLLPPIVGDPLHGWSAQARTHLAERLSTGLAARAAERPGAVFDDVRGLLSGVQESLDWVRDVERWSTELSELGGCKAALYRLRVFGEVLEGHADRYWTNGASWEPIVELDELDQWVGRVAARRDRLQHRLPSPVRPLLGSALAAVESGQRFQRAVGEFAEELLSIVDSSGADEVPEDAGSVDAVAEARAVLHRIADRIAGVALPRTETDAPEQLGYALLENARNRPEVLRRLVVLTAPLDVGRAPGSHINLLRVVGDEQTPLPFDSLRRGDSELRIDDKLRGTDLANFGGFLSARWRANDWMWGRMDAASSLAGLLLDPVRLVRRNADLSADGLVDRIREIVTRPTAEELGELDERRAQRWRGFLADLWSEHADAVRAEIATMYRQPTDGVPLTETKKLITARLHWTIAANELPVVAAVASGADESRHENPPPVDPERLARDVQRFSVGRQRIRDLGERRTASVATRLGLLAYRAARPSVRGSSPVSAILLWSAGIAMTVLKPVLLALALVIAAPRRAALVGMLASATGALADSVLSRLGPLPHWLAVIGKVHPPSAGAVVAGVLSAAFAAWWGWNLFGRGRVRGVSAALLAVLELGLLSWVFVAGIRIGPFGIVLIGGVLTWLAAFALRFTGRLVATLLTLVVSGAVLFLLRGPDWVVPAVVVTAYAQMLLLSTVDVLRPRPRPSGTS